MPRDVDTVTDAPTAGSASATSAGGSAGVEARGGPAPKPGTLTRLFFDAVEKFDRPDALQFKAGGRYQPISHREVAQRVQHLALGLQELGMRRGDRIAILSENRPEWAIADFGCLATGITDVPLYPTLPAEQIIHPLVDSGSRAIFVATCGAGGQGGERAGPAPGAGAGDRLRRGRVGGDGSHHRRGGAPWRVRRDRGTAGALP